MLWLLDMCCCRLCIKKKKTSCVDLRVIKSLEICIMSSSSITSAKFTSMLANLSSIPLVGNL